MKKIQLYETLKKIILESQLLPGQRLYPSELAKKLKISSTPMREVLNQLCQEGYISHTISKGFTLRIISNEEIEELYEFCEALESYAIEKGMSKITKSDLVELRENLKNYKEIIEAVYSRERFIINNQFHLKIASLMGNEMINQELTEIYEKIVYKWKVENIHKGRGTEAYDEHMAIYNSLVKKDLTSAVENMRNHIINSKNFVLQILEKKKHFLIT